MKRSRAPSVLAAEKKAAAAAQQLVPEAPAPVPLPPPPSPSPPLPAPPPLPAVIVAPPERDWTSGRGPPAILQLTEEDCHKTWRIATTRVENTPGGCFLATGKGFCECKGKVSKYHYRQISFVPGKNNIRPMAHVFAWYYWNAVQVKRHVYNPEHHISHRCGVHECINPEHLVQEPGEQNEARKNCKVVGSYTMCPHVPKCIGHNAL